MHLRGQLPCPGCRGMSLSFRQVTLKLQHFKLLKNKRDVYSTISINMNCDTNFLSTEDRSLSLESVISHTMDLSSNTNATIDGESTNPLTKPENYAVMGGHFLSMQIMASKAPSMNNLDQMDGPERHERPLTTTGANQDGKLSTKGQSNGKHVRPSTSGATQSETREPTTYHDQHVVPVLVVGSQSDRTRKSSPAQQELLSLARLELLSSSRTTGHSSRRESPAHSLASSRRGSISIHSRRESARSPIKTPISFQQPFKPIYVEYIAVRAYYYTNEIIMSIN